MKDFVLILPEIFLALTLAGLIFSEVGYHGERLRLVRGTALLGLGGAFLQTVLAYRFDEALIFDGSLSFDLYSQFFRLFFISLAALAVVGASRSREIRLRHQAEYYSLVIAAALALSLSAAANNLLLTFLCLQMGNLIFHFLAAFGRRSLGSTEAAVKHLLFSAVSSVAFLFAVALLFAATRTLNVGQLHELLINEPLPAQTAYTVFSFLFISIAFQFAAFPMHLWASDVIEGAPTPVSAFVSIGSRAAGIAVSVRLFLALFAQSGDAGHWKVLGVLNWPVVLAWVAGATLFVGSLLAFRQQGAKRLVASLVIAQTGYLLIGLLVLDQSGLAAMLYNLIIELFALMGAFYVIALFQDELKSDRLSDWTGMLRRALPETVALLLFLGTLVGLPPFAGFIGKFALVGAALHHQHDVLATIAILAWALGSVSITRVAFSLVGDFQSASAPAFSRPASRWTDLMLFFIPIVLLGFFANGVMVWTRSAFRPLFP